MDGKILLRARERLAQEKAERAAALDRREAEAFAAVPELREIEAELRGVLGRVVAAALRPGAEPSLARAQEESAALLARKKALLAARGWPEDYLSERFACPRCRDSGYLPDGSMCDCLQRLYEQEQAAALAEALQCASRRFADFDLGWYAGDDRAVMALTLDTAKNYALRFDRGAASMLFQGGTGLGKTFLSGCVAATVSDRGFGVVYETAQNAFAAFEEQKFSRDAETYAAASEKVRRILECDLFLLDDLGTELTTGFTQSALYNIVNTRLSEGRSTIISTNLSDAELEKRYLPQTVSRILGEYDVLLFVGKDIRALKKGRRYREA